MGDGGCAGDSSIQKNLVSLAEMREMPELDGMALLRPGQRLSIQAVEAEHWKLIKALGKAQKL